MYRVSTDAKRYRLVALVIGSISRTCMGWQSAHPRFFCTEISSIQNMTVEVFSVSGRSEFSNPDRRLRLLSVETPTISITAETITSRAQKCLWCREHA